MFQSPSTDAIVAHKVIEFGLTSSRTFLDDVMSDENQQSASRAREDEIKEVFSLFVETDSDTIPASSLGVIIRSLGCVPTDAEIEAFASQYGGDVGRISYEDFREIMTSTSERRLHSRDIVNAFRVFDTQNTGLISASELKRILMGMGEKLSAEEADDLLGEANVNAEGMIDYGEFAQHIMS